MKLSSDELGQVGEDQFRALCSLARMVCNKTGIDRTGWDFFVEIPSDVSKNADHLDSRPLPPQCLFQVKTIQSSTHNVTLRLSAAERLAKSPLPSFLIVLIAGDDHIETMHIQHVMGKTAERILKSLRACELRSSLQVNKKEITFSVRSLEKALPVAPDVLREVITKECPADMAEYTKRKFEALRSVGFEASRISGSFCITTNNPSDLQDFLLGRTILEVEAMKTIEHRWGIPRELETQSGGRVTIRQTGKRSNIRLRSASGLSSVNLSADVYIASKPDFGVQTTVCVITEALDFELSASGGKFDFVTDFKESTPISLKELIRTNRVYEILARGNALVQITPHEGSPLEMPISSEAAVTEAPTIFGFGSTLGLIGRLIDAAGHDDIIITRSEIKTHFSKLMLIGKAVRTGDTFNVSIGLENPKQLETMRDVSVVEGLFIDAVRFERQIIAYYCLGDFGVDYSGQEPRLRVQNCRLRQM